MPTRLLREGILSSDPINLLDWAEEVFYRRLMSKVDDHGLYDARLSVLRSSLYPLKVDRVREADITRWMAACQKAGLIVLYEAGGKPYLQMLNTKWEKRGKAKYPIPNDSQPLTTVNTSTVFVVVDEDVGEGTAAPRRDTRARSKAKTQIPKNFAISKRVEVWAASKGFDRLPLHLESFVSKCRAKGYTYADHDEGFMGAIRDNWAKLTPANGAGKGRLDACDNVIDGHPCGKPAAYWKSHHAHCRECGPV